MLNDMLRTMTTPASAMAPSSAIDLLAVSDPKRSFDSRLQQEVLSSRLRCPDRNTVIVGFSSPGKRGETQLRDHT